MTICTIDSMGLSGTKVLMKNFHVFVKCYGMGTLQP